jgi:hypothetical protein
LGTLWTVGERRELRCDCIGTDPAWSSPNSTGQSRTLVDAWSRPSATSLAKPPIALMRISQRKLGIVLMNASIISALAGLIGAAIGGLTSGLASWFVQKTQAHLQWLVHERSRRQDLYKEFIEAASQCYADALLHEKPEMSALVDLYAKIGRMRLLSSPTVVASAEQIGRRINETYLEPNKTFIELQKMIDSNAIDILGDFSKACREEFESLGPKQF